VRAARHALEQREIAAVLDLFQPMCGTLGPAGESPHRAGNDVQALALAELLALGEEELIAQADAEERAASSMAARTAIQERSAPRFAIASWKAPSPGSTTASASSTTRGSSVTTARMPEAAKAFSTLPRFPGRSR
jgi:hypothetical protein